MEGAGKGKKLDKSEIVLIFLLFFADVRERESRLHVKAQHIRL